MYPITCKGTRQNEAMRTDATPYLEFVGGQWVSFYEGHCERYDGQNAKREVDHYGAPGTSPFASDDLDVVRNGLDHIPAALWSS